MPTPIRPVDLNMDLGEAPLDGDAGGEPEELWSIATAVNVACGGHAGDEQTMRRALRLAARVGARVIAHPSYPDRAGFGRRRRFCAPEDARRAVQDQCAVLRRIARESGLEIRGVKAHGALYHDADDADGYAAALLDGASAALPALASVVGPPGGRLEESARARGLAYEREGFADRRYDARRKLVPRSEADALLTDPAACAAQALALARSGRHETLCMHGDTPAAATLARAVRDALASEGLLRGCDADRSIR